MKTKNIIMTVVIVLLLITLVWVTKSKWTPGGWQNNLVSPVLYKLQGRKVETSPTPKPTPRTFKFDKNTNLEQELENVNSGVTEEDFSRVKEIINNL